MREWTESNVDEQLSRMHLVCSACKFTVNITIMYLHMRVKDFWIDSFIHRRPS